MKLLSLFKPEYCYRPRQILRRLGAGAPASGVPFAQARLPWGLPLRVRPAEHIGRCILQLGVFELLVSESVWRLTDPGETVCDVGANIGYITSIMARRVGPRGAVWAFEPHPEVFKELEFNTRQWAGPAVGMVKPVNAAVSDEPGRKRLNIPAAFSENRGLSTLEPGDRDADANGAGASPGDRVTVPIDSVSLDQLFPNGERIGLVKMDVEGHELSVLRGAGNLLAERRVRDWIFEAGSGYPSPVTDHLARHGCTVLKLKKCFSHPSLLLPDAPTTLGRGEAPESPNFLATLEPERAKQRFASRGWQALRG